MIEEHILTELKRAAQIFLVLNTQIAGQHKNQTGREAITASFLSLAMSHYEASLLLIHHDHLVGSALALGRPFAEAVFRGLYVLFLANDAQVKNASLGKLNYPGIGKSAEKLESILGASNLLGAFQGDAVKLLHGYAHGGIEQLASRIDDAGVIGSYYSPEEIDDFLIKSSVLLSIAVSAFLLQTGKEASAQMIWQEFSSLYNN